MPEIATLTVNPAVDKSSSVENVMPEHKLRCGRPGFEPGGGGINVSRALKKLGGESLAAYVSGGPTGEMLRRLLEEEGVESMRLESEGGWTRENLTVYEHSSGQQFRFVFPGPELSVDWCDFCLGELKKIDPSPDYLVASGSLPPGTPDDFYARLASMGGEIGAKVVVDSSKQALKRSLEGRPFLIKPNLRELRQISGRELEEEKQQADAARELVEQGKVEIVVLSLGAAGALLVTSEGPERLRAPTVSIKSKVGAGDSTVAGIVLGLSRGMDIADAARFGIASGAAAVMTPGSELCRREDAEALFEELKRS
jgi:6-phosphofructokinase 2